MKNSDTIERLAVTATRLSAVALALADALFYGNSGGKQYAEAAYFLSEALKTLDSELSAAVFEDNKKSPAVRPDARGEKENIQL